MKVRTFFIPVVCCLFLVGATVVSTLSTMNAARREGVKLTVLDPGGRAVPNAEISVTGEGLAVPLRARTDAQGNAELTGLIPGDYKLTISASGFNDLSQTVTIKPGAAEQLKLKLEVAPTTETVSVAASSKSGDPVYQKLRAAIGAEVLAAPVENLELYRDAGKFTFIRGKIYLLPPTGERLLQAVFVGEGKFRLVPIHWIEKKYLKAMTQADTFVEEFSQIYIHATDGVLEDWKKKLAFTPASLTEIQSIVDDHRRELRKTLPQRGSGYFRGNDNFAAVELASVYWPERPGYFHAFIKGNKNKSLWYGVDRSGFFPGIGPEEVGLFNYDEMDFNLLHHGHLAERYASGTASSSTDHAVIDVTHYKLDSVINKENLVASAEVDFTAKATGPRVLTFGLESLLRVGRVTDEKGAAVPFIQESEKEDGSLNVILPEPIQTGKEYKLKFAYEGKGVVNDAGGGNYYVALRTSWYPSYGTFNDYAMYDMTFRSPKKFTIVATGKPVSQTEEKDYVVSTWTSPQPMVVAGFNLAKYKKKTAKEQNTDIEVYATESLPDFLRQIDLAPPPDSAGPGGPGGGVGLSEQSAVGVITPTRLADNAVAETINALKIYNLYFGEYPYGRIAISQQPYENFGQAWPMLVYLPITSFLDRTQLFSLYRTNRFGKFIDIVGPHEMAHQWWGHIVVWSSYHDQWLSEGFADFSAALYLEKAVGMKRAMEFWDEERRTVIEKNQFGLSAAEVGPLWMGQRLAFGQKTRDISRRTMYPKGAYVLYMLRMLMWDQQTGDKNFIDMMKDFTKTYQFKRASTEDFKTVAERHMTPMMNLQGNGKLDWFFTNWVYGTEIPEYSFQANIGDLVDGKVKITGTLTQRNVSNTFAMLVPVYAEVEDGKPPIMLGRLRAVGNQTQPIDVTVPLPKRPKRVFINGRNDILCTTK